MLFIQRFFTQKFFLHRFFTQKFFLHKLFTQKLFTQKFFLHILFTQRLFTQNILNHEFLGFHPACAKMEKMAGQESHLHLGPSRKYPNPVLSCREMWILYF
jgi:hypothetical protein